MNYSIPLSRAIQRQVARKLQRAPRRNKFEYERSRWLLDLGVYFFLI
jgi:hypothetical protein